MSAPTLPDIGKSSTYAAYVERLLDGRPDPATAAQVVAVVAGLEAALQRLAAEDIDIEMRLTVLEEQLLRRLEAIDDALSGRSLPSSE